MKKTVAEEFAADPRVIEAKRVLLETLADHRRSITGIRPPDPERQVSYEQVLTRYGHDRGAPLFFPYLGSGIGNGCLVELADGSIKYDFISGIGVHYLGHSHPDVVEACLTAALHDTAMQGNLQQDLACAGFAERLIGAANGKGGRLTHCFFSTSGAMANENALKLIFQKKYPADRLLAFEGCFMGRTLALAQVTDKPAYREGLPDTLSVDYIPFFDMERPEQSIREAQGSLLRHIARYPGKHAAMCMELVLGEGGFHPGSRDFFLALLEILRKHCIPVLFDEIQTFGRTTELFAFQHFGLDDYADVVTVGKSLQVCATLYREEFNPRAGLLSQTFTSSTAAFFVADVTLRTLMEGGFFGPAGRIVQLHERLVGRLEEIRARHPGLLSGPYGIGAMAAFTPLRGDPERVKAFIHKLFHEGVICFYAGAANSRVRFLLPAAAVTVEDIDAVLGIVERVLTEEAP